MGVDIPAHLGRQHDGRSRAHDRVDRHGEERAREEFGDEENRAEFEDAGVPGREEVRDVQPRADSGRDGALR